MLWALTCYFNPARYRRKLLNFRAFRRSIGVPLVAVELVYGGEPELTGDDAERLVQVPGHDVLWQKERLLNLALQTVPDDCRAIAWVDGDILFERANWASRAVSLLKRQALVQLFSEVYELGRGFDPTRHACDRSQATFAGPGIAHEVVRARGHVDLFALGPGIRACGLGWAARRDVIEPSGLYDACILGGGDRALVAAALGDFDGPGQAWRWNARQCSHYQRWARPFYERVGGLIGSVEGAVFHLWHGDAGHRRYRQRQLDLAGLGFDPARDIALDARGCWRWSSDRPELHAYVTRYFEGRREDG